MKPKFAHPTPRDLYFERKQSDSLASIQFTPDAPPHVDYLTPAILGILVAATLILLVVA